jgi:hypothetical protein
MLFACLRFNGTQKQEHAGYPVASTEPDAQATEIAKRSRGASGGDPRRRQEFLTASESMKGYSK